MYHSEDGSYESERQLDGGRLNDQGLRARDQLHIREGEDIVASEEHPPQSQEHADARSVQVEPDDVSPQLLHGVLEHCEGNAGALWPERHDPEEVARRQIPPVQRHIDRQQPSWHGLREEAATDLQATEVPRRDLQHTQAK